MKSEKHKVTVNLKAEQQHSEVLKTEFKILEDEIKTNKNLLSKNTELLDIKITEEQCAKI